MNTIEEETGKLRDSHDCGCEFHQIYCEVCGWQPVLVEPPRWDATGKLIFGDIMCSNCHLVIGVVRYDLKEPPQK